MPGRRGIWTGCLQPLYLVVITRYGCIHQITYKIYPALCWNRAQEEFPQTAQTVVDNIQINTLISGFGSILTKFTLPGAGVG